MFIQNCWDSPSHSSMVHQRSSSSPDQTVSSVSTLGGVRSATWRGVHVGEWSGDPGGVRGPPPGGVLSLFGASMSSSKISNMAASGDTRPAIRSSCCIGDGPGATNSNGWSLIPPAVAKTRASPNTAIVPSGGSWRTCCRWLGSSLNIGRPWLMRSRMALPIKSKIDTGWSLRALPGSVGAVLAGQSSSFQPAFTNPGRLAYIAPVARLKRLPRRGAPVRRGGICRMRIEVRRARRWPRERERERISSFSGEW